MSEHDTVNCANVAPYLSAYADGELAEPLRSQVAEHVSGCAECSARIDRIRVIDGLVASLPRTAPSADVYERTFAAATRNRAADPRAVTREALPGGRGGEFRRRLREIIAPDVPQIDAHEPVIGAARPTMRRRERAPWIAAAIPVVAALLLIALAATLFNRFPSLPRQGSPNLPTPDTSSPLQQTQASIHAVASQLAFSPISPTYLPSGASAPQTRIGPAEQVQANSRYLDVTWNFGSGPAQSLHLRELPKGLQFDGFTPMIGSTATALEWSLPAMSGWRPLASSACPNCLAVGETHATLQVALEAQPRNGASADAIAAWLRLVSLSIDVPYKPLSLRLSAPDSSYALRYQASVTDTHGHDWLWDVATVGALGEQQSAHVTGGGVDVTEIINNGSGARYDNINRIYQALQPPLPSAQPPHSATQPLIAASDYVNVGELWNLGMTQVTLPDGRALSAYDFYWVNATQPEHIYADVATGQTLALVVATTSTTHPGGQNGAQTFVSTTACQPYTVTYSFIEFLPQNALAANTFDTRQPQNYSGGAVAPAFTCQ